MSRALASSPAAAVLMRVDVPSDDQLRALVDDTVAACPHASGPSRCVLHDVYYDTTARILAQSGLSCRVRTVEAGDRILAVGVHSPLCGVNGPAEALVEVAIVGHGDAWRTEHNDAVALLQRYIDPADLVATLEMVTERLHVRAPAGLLRRPVVECEFDKVTVRVHGHTRSFREATVWRLADGNSLADGIAERWRSELRPLGADVTALARAREAVEDIDSELAAERLGVGAVTVVLATRGTDIACVRTADGLRLPSLDGAGPLVARRLSDKAGGDSRSLIRLGIAHATPSRPRVESWLTRVGRRDADDVGANEVVWVPAYDLLTAAGSPWLRDAPTVAALAMLGESSAIDVLALAAFQPLFDFERPPPEPVMLDAELGVIDFNARVLAMAEDPRAGVAERLRMLAITAANLDEFVMVRLADLKSRTGDRPSGKPGAAGMGPTTRFDAARSRLAALGMRQARCCADILAALGTEHGIRVRSWTELAVEEREDARAWFVTDVAPAITNGGMTLALGHPFPRLPSLGLSLCVVGRSRVTGEWRVAQFDLPRDVARFVGVSGSSDVIGVEEIARACADSVCTDLDVATVYLFRVIREGDLVLTEQGDLFDRVEEGTRRRGFNHVVRIEVERAMPAPLREALLAAFQVEPGISDNALTLTDIHAAHGTLGLAGMRELAAGAMIVRSHRDAEFPGAGTSDSSAPTPSSMAPLHAVWSELASGDRLYHHPYVSYESTVLRFLAAAAADPAVDSIQVTLYRVGDPSPVIDALLAARSAGKRVAAYVELTARFDETRNLAWVHRLEEGGVSVAYGRGTLKCHAKVALVERREADGLRRYAHVGTGNYNAVSARMYTDFSLLTADSRITGDLHRFFDWLAGDLHADLHSGWCLVAPHELLPGLLARIEREIGHARAGRPARIRLKVNALSEDDLVNALYRASAAGVEVDLIVRGTCTLRPGVRGLSERVRVASRIGRFLEHGRIYHFGNGGADEYFIGSADWRPRNMRRRIEVVVPVLDAGARAQLGRILDIEAADPLRWRLDPGGRYTRPALSTEPSADDRFSTLY